MTGAVETPRATRREWVGLVAIALPCVLYSMDLTVLNLAVPALSVDLKPSSAQLLWIIDIYGFLVAGSLITMGTLGDRIGRRRLLLIGSAAFAAASVVAAFSRSAGMLIAARALLGVAGATVAPSTLSLIRNMFHDPKQRTIAVSVWVTSYSVGGAIGPLLGGVMLQHFWWGSVFLLSVPVMALLLVVGPLLLPEFRDPGAGRLDLISAGLSLVAVLAVIFGLKRMAEHGPEWTAALSIVAGLAAGLVFVRRQQGLATPLIDLRLFQAAAFSASLATYALSCFVAFGSYIFIAQYLQLVLGLKPLAAGLWTLPWSAGFIAGSALTPAIVRRFHPAVVTAAGLLVGAVGFGVVSLVTVATGLTSIAVGSIVLSIGLAPAVTLANDLILGSAPPERAGAAAGISETSAEMGGALGIAILGSVGTVVYRGMMTASAPAGISPGDLSTARGTLGGALAVAERLSGQLGVPLLHAARESFLQAMRLTMGICAAVSLATAIVAAILLRRVSLGGAQETKADTGTVAGA